MTAIVTLRKGYINNSSKLQVKFCHTVVDPGIWNGWGGLPLP